MKSEVILRKIQSEIFKNYLQELKNNMANKKVLIYADKKAFNLIKPYGIFDNIDIAKVLFDKKINGLETEKENEIENGKFDCILSISDNYINIKRKYDEKFPIYNLFKELLPQEECFLEELEKNKFEKRIISLSKKIKEKKVILYGVGMYFEVMKAYYNLNKLNIIGVCDMKFEKNPEGNFMGYKKYTPRELVNSQTDYVLITLQKFIHVLENLRYDVLKNSNIKVMPITKPSLYNIIKEIWF